MFYTVAFSHLIYLTFQIKPNKHRANNNQREVVQLQCRLDEKEGECEDLMNNIQKTRGDSLRKLEQMRRASEDKIAFLLQQLRAAEARVVETSTLLRRSCDTAIESPFFSTTQDEKIDTTRISGGINQFNSRVPDATLLAYGRDGRESLDFGLTDYDFRREVCGRWMAEKERREQLERRNSELAKEVRSLRDKR